MRGAVSPTVGILADDLTGGADAAAPFLDRGMSVEVVRDGREPEAGSAPDVIAFVSNSRDSELRRAREQVSRGLAALLRVRPGLVLKKIDSTLRGHLGFELSLACQMLEPHLVLVAPAFPAHGRQLIGGRLVLEGSTSGTAPLTELLAGAGLTVESVGLESVRSRSLPNLFSALPPGSVVVCDAELDADLASIVAAGSLLDRRVLWVGSGGLAAALAASSAPLAAAAPPTIRGGDGPVVVAVGSWSERAREQALLLDGTCRTLALEVDALTRWDADLTMRLRSALAEGGDVLVVPDGPVDPERSEAVAEGLARVLVAARPDYRGLVLTGGATAEAAFDGLGITSFGLLREIEVGVPLGVGVDGLPFVTKAGSFGDGAILQRCVAALHGVLQVTQS